MTETTGVPWLSWLLALLCAAAILTAVLVIGPTSQSAATRSRIVTVQRGVVQSTVSGSGNLQAAEQLDLGFKTAGTVEHIYVSEGQHVTQGQLLAELNPQSATVNLEQAKASLQAAEATLVSEEENGGETSSSQSQGNPSARAATYTEDREAARPTAGSVSSAPASTPPTRSTPTTGSKTVNRTTPQKKPERTGGSTSSQTTTASGASTTSETEKTRQSAATREANLASARAAVKSDRLAVLSDEQSVASTRLYAPFSGTIVSLSGEVGETVSGGGTSKASSAGSSSSSASSSSGLGAAASRSTGASSSSSSSGSSSSASSFAVLSDLSRIDLVVPLSESEIVHVHTGQPATVTVEALEGVKLAAHVVSIATLSSSNSGVVSYDVTFALDQLQSGLKPGMSASAEVVVKQAEGVNVPSSAISAGTVTVLSAGKQVRRTVLTGLAGNSSTIILSGLRAGEQIALPVASAGTGASLLSRLAGRSGGTLGGLGGGGGGGFAARGFGGGGLAGGR